MASNLLQALRVPRRPTQIEQIGFVGSRGTSGIAEQLQNVKRMRLAIASPSGTPTATNLSFLLFRALGTSKIGFLGEKHIIFDGANVSERRKYDLFTFCEIIFGVPTGGPTGGLRSQVSGHRSQVLGVRSQASCLRFYVSGSGPRSQVPGLWF